MTDDPKTPPANRGKAAKNAISLLSYLGCPDEAAAVTGLVAEVSCLCSKLGDATLSVIAVSEIRKMLLHHGVPQAAYIDDHVANAIVQRNRMQELVESIVTKVDELWDPVSQDERAEKLKFMATVTGTLAEYGHGKQAENNQAEARGVQAPPSGGS